MIAHDNIILAAYKSLIRLHGELEEALVGTPSSSPTYPKIVNSMAKVEEAMRAYEQGREAVQDLRHLWLQGDQGQGRGGH